MKAIWADPKELQLTPAGLPWIRAGKRWRMPSICRWISWRRASIPIRGCGFIYLARQVNPDMADYIKKLKLPGIHLREESRRYYPSGEVTAAPHRLYQRR
ncbi:hypothetical protein LNP74_00890 [Klebsiella pneumoniae subsp. pneumoniae]|nr:hypothetical protein [Klebsiella pneumoniae subsp. pneumoniae]